jgi:predicted HicB family RNase H-like nuclease
MGPWERYAYRITWSEEDGEFVGLCAELPGLSWLAPTHGDALTGIVAAARDAVRILEEDGDPVPEPLSMHKYSGVFKVRVPPEVHKGLALEAAEQNVSLNRIVTVKLSRRQLVTASQQGAGSGARGPSIATTRSRRPSAQPK